MRVDICFYHKRAQCAQSYVPSCDFGLFWRFVCTAMPVSVFTAVNNAVFESGSHGTIDVALFGAETLSE